MSWNSLTRRLGTEVRKSNGTEEESIHIERLVLGVVQTNCYIVENHSDHTAVIIDPADQSEVIEKVIRERGLKPVMLLLTHGHFDHAMAAPALSEKWNIPVAVHETEQAVLEDARLTASFLIPGLAFRMKPDCLLVHTQELEPAGFRIQVLHTPGHTQGSVCYYLPDYDVLFSGDTLFYRSVGRTDLPTGNAGTLMRSVREITDLIPEYTMVLPGHGGSTSIGIEKKYNPYLDEGGFWE